MMTGVTKSPNAGAAFCLALAHAASLPVVTVPAQEWSSIAAGDAAAGKELIESRCGSCHVSGKSGLLISGSGLTQDDLAERVRDRQTLLLALHFERHPAMPKYLFRENETNNIMAYFAQLRTGNAQQPFPRSWTR
jgi:mono/diheme cytochrome c family protein